MFKYILLTLAIVNIGTAQAQNKIKILIKNAETSETIPGVTASIGQTNLSSVSNDEGLVIFENLQQGVYNVTFSMEGYKSQIVTVTVPFKSEVLEISLESEAEEMDEIIVTSTRGTRTISNIPTRVEFIAGEELEEKANMKPGDIRMMLNESTGIQTQQTSATSGNSSIRIQGLDGRYTQILKDGFPVYSGASSGLGLLQTPPLDLKQVEIIKGSASTLYGGGAIAGLVNLISKTPTEERELRFLLNGTSALGLNVNGFYSQRFNKIGLTVFASHDRNAPYDPADIQLTAIPKFERFNFNPKLFVYFNENTKLNFGINTVFENRIGGNIDYIKDQSNFPDSYFEKNKTQRISTQFTLTHRLSEKESLTFKNSFNNFSRVITIPDYTFDGIQNSTFSEITYSLNNEKSEWAAGANLYTDKFTENSATAFPLRDYNQITYGAFIQNTVKAKEWLDIETGLRGDYVIDYGFSLLPRISALFKITPKLTSRLGGGLGYKTPTIFTEESERIQYQNVLPINSDFNKLEKSYGVNFDVNYKTNITEDISLSINQLFFYTNVDNPLILTSLPDNIYQFVNVNGYLDTKGTETNLKLGYKDFKLFLGYTYTDASIDDNGIKSENPLTAKHRLNNVLMYEVEDKWKAGLEAYYYSPQKLNDGTTGREYWIFGFMVEKLWENFSVFANFENFTDTRQTKFGSIYTGPISNPVFKDIYAPLDGFVINAGLKIKL
ncbi:TonB-dependent receptor plug domain-containing protein [Flavobacterium pectinovorum]|jgi:outer membrane receptor for ferrienterochelin and colicin|uniref:TonB-dependent receptor n=1 Tax=Flavobacterium pectinovorum TaxID=29533 RepID=UPI001FACB7BA|nr:TonB-dependent receptor plug domain-containing protein [Flavobacterium pectinovorum]MCI9846944.1 TonB-dependent receptor [Flavobacterium pectinovorum]